MVVKKKKQGRPPPPKQGSKVLADLIDLCFNCFASDHIARYCPNQACRFCCREPGNTTQACKRPRVLRGERCRPAARGRKRARPAAPPLSSSPDGDTPSMHSCSTEEGLEYPPSIYAPPFDCSPKPNSRSPSPSPPLPLGDPAWRPQVELCVIHHDDEIAPVIVSRYAGTTLRIF
jgi:hypothetical protein